MRASYLAIGVAALAIGGTSLTPTDAAAQVLTVTAQLTGGQENPPVLTGSHGNATVTIDRGAQTITYRVNVYNLPTGLTASHIHVGPANAGLNGPIVVNFNVTQTISNDFAITGTATAADLQPRPQQGINSWDDLVMAIASGATYVNVHSQAFPGGEIRGQLCPASPQENTFNNVALCVATK
jgi:hypothetical protein